MEHNIEITDGDSIKIVDKETGAVLEINTMHWGITKDGKETGIDFFVYPTNEAGIVAWKTDSDDESPLNEHFPQGAYLQIVTPRTKP